MQMDFFIHRKRTNGVPLLVHVEPREVMPESQNDAVWILADDGKVDWVSIAMSTDQALILAIDLLKNVSHKFQTDELAGKITSQYVAAIVREFEASGMGDLVESNGQKLAEVIPIKGRPQ